MSGYLFLLFINHDTRSLPESSYMYASSILSSIADRRKCLTLRLDSALHTCAGTSSEAAAGGVVAGRKAVDFENLAFAQGNHLMTNKKCDLPQKSYRAAHKVCWQQAALLCSSPQAQGVCSRGEAATYCRSAILGTTCLQGYADPQQSAEQGG